jgi:hypothetical protein
MNVNTYFIVGIMALSSPPRRRRAVARQPRPTREARAEERLQALQAPCADLCTEALLARKRATELDTALLQSLAALSTACLSWRAYGAEHSAGYGAG